MAQNITIKLAELEGKWYIIQSNFPMWLKGDKTSPTFNYTLANKDNEPYLLDSVQYIKNGKTKSINGTDKPLNDSNTKFIWRGNKLLKILKSKWSIIYFDRENEWAIIKFEKSLVTPKGFDVISRNPILKTEVKDAINEHVSKLNTNKKLVPIPQALI